MKQFYLLVILITSFAVNGQSSCDNANYYLVSAYSHVKTSYEANNISHLKYSANRSVEALKLSKKTLPTCSCEKALELADKAIFLLSKVENAETYEDGRFYVKQGRDMCQESVIEIDKCATSKKTTETVNEQSLNDLEKEQLKLKQQQEALKLKEAEIKAKLAEQKEREIHLKKEQLILNYKTLLSSNIKTYNETLKACNCNHKTISNSDDASSDISNNNLEEIKVFYIEKLKTIAENYLAELNTCH
ncbi:hypothetical protein [Mariniflexile sp.]|uniref:hypothetical protein n=1 Tax=Mariniflexile sp. TaxID=1979402 RepID=UPI0035633EDD